MEKCILENNTFSTETPISLWFDNEDSGSVQVREVTFCGAFDCTVLAKSSFYDDAVAKPETITENAEYLELCNAIAQEIQVATCEQSLTCALRRNHLEQSFDIITKHILRSTKSALRVRFGIDLTTIAFKSFTVLDANGIQIYNWEA